MMITGKINNKKKYARILIRQNGNQKYNKVLHPIINGRNLYNRIPIRIK